MPRLPGFGDILAVLQAQTEALAALPSTVAAPNRSVRGLSDAVDAMYGTVTPCTGPPRGWTGCSTRSRSR